MLAFLSWYFLISLLGWASFPFVFRLFGSLPDRGYTLARAAGLLVWGYVFWLVATLGFLENDLTGLIFALLLVIVLSGWAIRRKQGEILAWLKANWRLILVSELLFLASFAALALIRAANPEIYGTEKPMELAFINATLRSPEFPPRDPWLSGYAISYYHFGYILTAMLARMTAVPGTIAFNLMLALVFGMGALGAYGVLFNLLAALRPSSGPDTVHRPNVGLPLLAPLFYLLVSNFEGLLEVIHRAGFFWHFNPDGSASSGFWSWLDIMDLTQPPAQPLGLMPDRYLWWWRASRVIQDYDLAHNWKEIIDEFPAFSFVLGDLHPHILAIPFGFLAVASAFNLFRGGWHGSTNILGARLKISSLGLIWCAFILGGLAFLNIWDVVMVGALFCFSYVLLRVQERGWAWERFEDLLFLGLPMVLLGGLFYLPFFLSFSSQAGGILPNLAYPTRGAHLWVMFGTLLLPIGAYLIYSVSSTSGRKWRAALAVAIGLPLVLWLLSWVLAWFVSLVRPDVAMDVLVSQGMSDFGSFFLAAGARRLAYMAGLLTIALVLFLAIIPPANEQRREDPPLDGHLEPVGTSSGLFVAIMLFIGALLVLVPEFVYLRDQFGWRMNTIFKFYYQAWMLWSICAAFAVAFLLQRLRGAWDWLFHICLFLLLVAGLIYPVLAFSTKTNGFNPPAGYTLNDFDRIRRENPDEAGAIEYLRSAPDGVVAEAIGGSYTNFARISTYTGLPTVLGWPGHEVQWRGTAEPQGTRQDDIAQLYTTTDWDVARGILENYDIRYVVVGGLERQAYPVQEEKFRRNLLTVYQTGTISVYQVP